MKDVASQTKTCPSCRAQKPLDAFYVRSDTGKPSSWCKACIRARAARQRHARRELGLPAYNPLVDVWSHRARKYGVSREAFEAMFADQDGRCAICGEPGDYRGLCVDHDHRTGQVRGLLCNKCNWGLGHFNDDSDLLMNAITYLESFRAREEDW
jgi:hypothetical protein